MLSLFTKQIIRKLIPLSPTFLFGIKQNNHLNAANKNGPCKCVSHKCKGQIRNEKTLRRHAKDDFQLIKNDADENTDSVRLTGCSFDPSLYENHSAAKLPLYNGSQLSVLDHVFLEMRKFVSHPSQSKASVSENFRYDKHFKLPQPNNCVTSYNEAKSLISNFLIPLQTYHVCPNDCVIYKGGLETVVNCPKCNTSRFDKQKPKKIFKYFPIAPRIARIYQNENLIKVIQAHSNEVGQESITDIWHTKRWRDDWFGIGGEFKGDQTGCVLNFCSDGVNPYKSLHVNYSMWPLMMSVLNFPIALRKSVAGIFLLGIIPGNGTKEPFHLDPYFDLIVEELLILAECHTYYPTYMKAPINIRVKLLQFVLDFPAISKVLHQPSQGSIMACPWCDITGCYSHSLRKTIYMQSRRYLDKDHVLRTSSSFIEKEKRTQPLPISVEYEEQKRQSYEILPNKNQKKKFMREIGVKGVYSFMNLPYHKFHRDYMPDAMHTISDVVEHVIAWLIGTKDFDQLETSENEMKQVKRRKIEKKISFLQENGKAIANDRCKSLKFPKDCSGFKGNIFSGGTSAKVVLKNTHGWTEYTSNNIWSYLIKDALDVKTRRTLTYFFWVLAKIHQKSFSQKEIDDLKTEMNVAMVLLERDCPIWLSNITTHILRHLTEKIKSNGPIYASWMYPYERMNSYITRRGMNRSKTEECIMETMQILDWVLYSNYFNMFQHLKDAENTMSRNIDRAFQRDGFIDIKLKGIACDLNERQTLAAKTFCTNLTSTKQFKEIIYDDAGKEDDIFRIGDIVHINEISKFGKICNLFEINGAMKLADIEIYTEHFEDLESGLMSANVDVAKELKLITISKLSTPLVTSTNENVIWFISYIPKLFCWYENHIFL